MVNGVDGRFDIHGVIVQDVELQPGIPRNGRCTPAGKMAVDIRLQHFARIVGADDSHGQIIVTHLREQGGQLQQFECILAENDRNISIDLALMVFHDVRRTGVQVLLMVGEILGGNHFLLQEVIQVIDVLQIGTQFRTDQFHRRPDGLAFVRPVDNSLQREGDCNARDNREQLVHEFSEPSYECETLGHGG